MLFNAIDTDASFDPSKMIDDVSTFIFCISTLSTILTSNFHALDSDTPFDPSMIDDVSDTDRGDIDRDDITMLSTVPAPLGLLSNIPADDIPMSVNIQVFQPRASPHAIGDDVSHFPTPLDLLMNVPAPRSRFLQDNISTTVPGDSSPPAASDDIPMLSNPDPQGLLSTLLKPL
jgi:hypothetical protein